MWYWDSCKLVRFPGNFCQYLNKISLYDGYLPNISFFVDNVFSLLLSTLYSFLSSLLSCFFLKSLCFSCFFQNCIFKRKCVWYTRIFFTLNKKHKIFIQYLFTTANMLYKLWITKLKITSCYKTLQDYDLTRSSHQIKIFKYNSFCN